MRALLCLPAMLLCACATRTEVRPTPEVPARPAPVAEPAPAAPTLRTDGSVRPTAGHLELTIIPESEGLSGKASYDLQIVRPTPVVWVNATGLTVSAATLAGAPAKVIPGNEDFVGVLAPAPLAVGPVRLELTFTGPIDHTRSLGVYAEKEGSDVYAYTFFEPVDARRAFPCFDEPSAKIPWTLSLIVKKDHVARANTAVVSEHDEANGLKRVDFATSRPLPSYLVAFMVGPFAVVDDGVAGRAKTPLQFIIPQGRERELAWAKEISPRVVSALEDYFGMAYPYGKLDVAVVPRYWGTMEHPGLVAMGQPLTLIRPEETTRPRMQAYANILAHELAHYWFGDLVTTAWWDDTWLNESLGQWADQIITDAVMPAWRVRDERVDFAARAMASDELPSTHPIKQTVTTREAIGGSFDNDITYFKGSSVMRMFEASVGPEKWRAFIQSYLHRHEDQNATAEDFLAEARQALGDEAGAGLASFINQPGVPRIEAAINCAAGKQGLTLSQRRSMAGGLPAPKPALWTVPVCVRAGDATHAQRACLTLATEQAFLPLPFCPSWAILNDEATGYYRSAANLELTRALFTPTSKQARLAKPSIAERKMLLTDLFSAVQRNELPLDQALPVAALAQRDADDRIVLEGLQNERVRTDGADDALHHRYLAFLRSRCAPLAGTLGWARGPKDSDDRQQLRHAAIHCAVQAKDPKQLAQASTLALAWLENKQKSGLSDDLVGTALGAAAQTADVARFEKLLAAARAATDRNARARLLGALGSVLDPALSARALALVLGTEFDLRETSRIVMGQLFQRETREATWQWLSAHLDELLARMRTDEASWFLGGLAGAFCDPKHHADVEALVQPRAQRIDGAPIAVTRGLEESTQCIAEQARDLPALKPYLDSQKH